MNDKNDIKLQFAILKLPLEILQRLKITVNIINKQNELISGFSK